MSLFFHKTLLLASGWIYYCYSPYRLSQRSLYKRFKYFYRDFHRTYCFLPFILSPSPSISLRPACASAKSLDPNQMSSHCLPTVAILQFLPAASSLHSLLPTTASWSPSCLLPLVLCLHLLFAVFLWLCADLPLSCFAPAIPGCTRWSANTHLQGRRCRDGSGEGGFGQSHTQSSKTQLEKWCLRPQALLC